MIKLILSLVCSLLFAFSCADTGADESTQEDATIFDPPLQEFTTSAEQPLYCYFTPPEKWARVDSDRTSSHVKMGFVGKTKSSFSPSLNLAVEKIDVTENEYLQIVKKIHQTDRKKQWRDLGKIQTASGEAHLTAIDTQTDFGNVRLMQVILVKDHTAYVLTGGALKEEFAKHYQEFQQAFQSLTVTHELPADLKDHPHVHSAFGEK